MMNSNRSIQEIIDQIALCDQCDLCVDRCPTYKASDKKEYTPSFRLNVANKLFKGEESLCPEEIESIYTCPQCGQCEVICPQGIKVSEVMEYCRREMAVRKYGPLDRHNKVIQGILEKGNAANGDPRKRWEWLPDEFPLRESDTLFYVGCLPCYLVQNSARSSYLLLKKLEVDFMMLHDEDCCGIYFYNAGRWDLAQKKFGENQERFRKLGITRIITPCAGCYYCFKRYYPRLLGESTFQVIHIVELLPTLIKEKGFSPKKINQTVIYLDPCRLGRKEKIFDSPREALKLCGIEVREMGNNREKAFCCGAGAGIRSAYRELSCQIASQVLENVPAESVVTSCPFCFFNINYTSVKEKKDKSIVYLTDLVLKSLS
jgi:Fe-S oxidoreductase